MKDITWVDAHHHLWNLNKIHYPWLMAKGEPRFFGQPDPIRQNYLLNDFQQDHQNKISRSVHIQVGCIEADNIAETAFVDAMSKQSHAHYPSAAVVAINMKADSIEEEINKHLAYNITRGVRDIIGKSPEENQSMPPFSSAVWHKNWQCLANNKLSFDLQLTSEQYIPVLKTLEKTPELNVAICHFASPWDQSDSGFSTWVQAMKQYAQLPHCYIKLSGFSMFTHHFNSNNFEKYAHAAIDIFGPERCMFGSNFPVDKLYVNYQTLFSYWQKVIQQYSPQAAHFLASQTAVNFYRL